ncbi:hypothetical protein OVN18_04610 [Microcella daejeonensis]|uniref:Alpha/beta hydrolase family protein n=1 Tax=Microcella daejeonensis TaxID=2994971 RepID=A0A9E8S9Q6_9MICO|nr:hypothetical protein [Microcella daejeonensis]WAB82294.1 hypothetical protein OVN18_04610 [Microcella daejeonensis]
MSPEPSLAIGGGGGSTVIAEHLLVAEHRLAQCADDCERAARRLRPLGAPLPGEAFDATGTVAETAAASLSRSSEELARLGTALRLALDGYEAADSAVRTALDHLLAPMAGLVGAAARSLLGAVSGPLLAALGVVAAGYALLPASSRAALDESARDGLRLLGERVLDDETTTMMAGLLLPHADDAVLGAVGVPRPIVERVQSMMPTIGGVEPGSVAATAGVAAVLGAAAGARGAAPVEVRRLPPVAAAGPPTPPVGLAGRVARIPDPAQPVRVEVYRGAGGAARYEVYIAGTAHDAPVGGEHPWDNASNISLVAEHDASSLRAVRAALADAGAGPGSSVVFTGYSQGGAVATLLAESGEFRTAGLVTVGAPTGGMPVAGDYPAVAIGHRDDIITALGGAPGATEAVLVTADSGGREEGDGLLAAHDLDGYRATAARADASEAPLLRDAVSGLPRGGLGQEAIDYTARRRDDD